MGRHKKLTREDRKQARKFGRSLAANALSNFRLFMRLSLPDGDGFKSVSMAGMDNYQLRAVRKAAALIWEVGNAAAYELFKRAQDRPRALAANEKAAARAAIDARYGPVREESARLQAYGVQRAERLTAMAAWEGTKLARRNARVLGARHEVEK